MNRFPIRTAAVAVVLTLAAAGCSDERAGVTTGVPSPPAAPRTPSAATPPLPGTGPAPSDRIFADENPQPIHVESNGHGYDIVPVVDGVGHIVSTRILEDGALMLDASGSLLDYTEGSTVPVSIYDHGAYISGGLVYLQATHASGTAALPQGAAAGFGMPPVVRDTLNRVRGGGPQRQMVLPCLTQLAAFGAASAYFSWALMTYKYNRTEANWAQLKAAAGAVLATGARLATCLAGAW